MNYQKNLIKSLLSKDFQNCPKVIFHSNQEVHISSAYLIVSGDIEVFICDEEGRQTKILNLSSEDLIIGLSKYIEIQTHSYFFRIASKATLVKIPSEKIKILLNDIHFNNFIIRTLYKRIADIGHNLFIRSNASNHELIRHLLLLEGRKRKEFKITSINNFLDKYNISRSAFYKGVNALEKLEEIKKEGKKITFLK